MEKSMALEIIKNLSQEEIAERIVELYECIKQTSKYEKMWNELFEIIKGLNGKDAIFLTNIYLLNEMKRIKDESSD